MQPVAYMDFGAAELSETVIFGTETGMEVMYTLLGWVLGGVMSFRKLEVYQAPSKKKMIELEQRFQLAGNVNDMLSMLNDRGLGELLWFIGLSQPPLLPLQDDEVKRYSKNTISRDKIQSIMDRVPINYRRLTGDLITTFRAYGCLRPYSTLLTHRPPDDVDLIISTISDRWDFESHCPLPKRVVRTYMGGEAWTVWESTGEHYVPLRRSTY
ncbi:hypothetical protein CPB86DRAFT_80356 [Serendipita vermifera]|nr:hypothetical protein CPB86DRAFT_80356 [Serendipita vermifera]